jgi:hypothetical protein
VSNVQPPLRKTAQFLPPLPSPSMNEGAIANIAPGDVTRIAIAEALRAVRIAAENARNASVAIFGDMTLSEGGKHVKANDLSFRITNAVLPVVDRAREKLEYEIGKLRAKTNAPAPDVSVRGNFMATEIRQRMASLDQSARLAALQEAIDEGPSGDAIIEAALGASGFLTGLTPLEVEHTRQKWRRKRFPDECKRIDLLERDAEHLNRGGSLLISYQRKCSYPAIVAAAAQSRDAAQKAIAAAGAAAH